MAPKQIIDIMQKFSQCALINGPLSFETTKKNIKLEMAKNFLSDKMVKVILLQSLTSIEQTQKVTYAVAMSASETFYIDSFQSNFYNQIFCLKSSLKPKIKKESTFIKDSILLKSKNITYSKGAVNLLYCRQSNGLFAHPWSNVID